MMTTLTLPKLNPYLDDQPTVYGRSTRSCYELKQLHRKLGVTTVYVTHDQREALTMSDRIAVINEGKIEQLGNPKEIYNSPNSSFVADFIGESSFIPLEKKKGQLIFSF